MPFRDGNKIVVSVHVDDDTLITKIPTIQTNTKEEMTVTVYCANCVYLFQRGGVWYCGCTTSDLYDKAVDPNWGKCCDYHKSR